jgi:1,4-dihydroxy-2-naphthoyl-CoA hydrolase
MKIWKSEFSIELLNEFDKNTMSDYLDIKFIEKGDHYLKASMPINDHVRQPANIMHGGASCVLAETVGSTAAQFCVEREKYHCVGIDINTNHIRMIKEGLVIATAKPYHLGKNTQVWGIKIRNEKEQLISISRLTLAVLKKNRNHL